MIPAAPPGAPKSTLVLLVRHGKTPATGMVLPGRAPGLHLSDRGRIQAERVAERLSGLPVDAIYSSPLERSCETAEPAAARTGLAVNGDAGLVDCDFGAWTGAAHAGGVVVCFSHADPIKAAVAHALGTHLDLFQRIVISPGSVSVISFGEGQAPAVLMVNSTLESLSGLRVP